jgi:uncharacterized protein with HEPN domain
MPRDYKVFLEDILEAVERIVAYTSDKAVADFTNDPRTFDAVIRNLLVIGEAVKSLPASFREKHSIIEWRKWAGFRDVLIHEYFGIKPNVVRNVVEEKIPHLRDQVKKILAEGQDK